MSEQHHDEYGDDFVAGLEWIWGEGFLSPGGREEVARILDGIELNGCAVLDIGCGIGGIEVLLVREHGAAAVTGIDVEAPLVARARATAERAGLADRVEIQLVEPGPLPFADGSFDVVFSKDSMIHIPDKAAAYREIHRVLKPGGRLAVSDWFGSGRPDTPEFAEWLGIVGLTFALGTLDSAAALLKKTGFGEIESVDRNAWYYQYMDQEIATVTGENFDRLVASLGRETAEQRRRSSTMKKTVVGQGMLRPGHLRARR